MSDPVAEPDSTPLPIWRAVWGALRSHEVDFYPQIIGADGRSALLPTKEMMIEFGAASKHWKDIDATDAQLDDAIKLARQSLDEVKDQTEYQDQKATRLLTVTTFLTALSGALFTRLNDAYPIARLSEEPWCWILLIGVAYVLFGLFLLASLSGALVTYHATRTRFKYTNDDVVAKDCGSPKSRLFYRSITNVRPKVWSLSFVEGPNEVTAGTKPKLRADLKCRYLTDLVGETYLVACKTADKLRYLDPAQRLLAMALRFLLFWVLALAVLAIIPHGKPSVPTQVKLIAPDSPVPVRADISKIPPIVPTPTQTQTQTPAPTSTLTQPTPAGSQPVPTEKKVG